MLPGGTGQEGEEEMSIAPGLRGEATVVVDRNNTTSALGTASIPTFATSH